MLSYARPRSLTTELLALSLLVTAWAHARAYDDNWAHMRHEPGRCAMYGECALRADGDALSCPFNDRAPAAEDDAAAIISQICPSLWSDSGGKLCCSAAQAQTLRTSLSRAEPFIIGCPACLANFRNLFCTLFCSPDQATFANVTAVQQAEPKPSGLVGSVERHDQDKVTAVAEVKFFLSEEFKTATFNSCKDVTFSPANIRVMHFIGDRATNAQEFLDFIGTVKDRTGTGVGSSIQMDFPNTSDPDSVPTSMAPWSAHVPPCWDIALRCSCGDCPEAITCEITDALLQAI